MIKNEIVRRSRFSLILLITAFILNLFLLYKSLVPDEYELNRYTAEQYNEVWEAVGSMETVSPEGIQAVCDSILPVQDAAWQNMLLQWQNALRQCMHYDATLADIIAKESTLDTPTAIVFMTEYDRDETVRTANDYRRLTDIKPVLTGWKGVSAYGSSGYTDLLIIIVMLSQVYVLVIGERESGGLLLSKSCFRGRYRLGAAKLTAILVRTVLISAVFYLSDIALIGLIYGFGDLSLPLQGVRGYALCPFRITIGGYLALLTAARLTILAGTGAVLFFIATVSEDTGRFFIYTGIMAIAFIACGSFIKENSQVEFLKAAGSHNITSVNDCFTQDVIISFFGIPVQKLYFVMASHAVYLLAGGGCGIILFAGIKESDLRKRHKPLIRFIPFGKAVSVLPHEIVKFLLIGVTPAVIAVLAVYTVTEYRSDVRYYPSENVYEYMYTEYLKGDTEPWKTEYLAGEKEEMRRLAERYRSLSEREKTTAAARDMVEQLKAEQALLYIADVKTPYLESVGGQYLHDTGFRLLTGDEAAGNTDAFLGIIYSLALIIPLGWLFAGEYDAGIHELIRSTYMADRVVHIKLLIGVVYALCICLVVYVPHFERILGHYGREGMDYKAVSMEHLINVAGDLSIGGYMNLIMAGRMLYGVIAVIAGALISRYTRGMAKTVIVMLVIFLLPVVLAYLNVSGIGR
ncbi:MAG: hypothetical protein IKN24_03215 [Lachnospiraceae bacterium]|nr:hypothetical protein [Lachnospiraceae bacterium]